MSIDWQKTLKSVIDLGTESYETKANRVMVNGALLVLILLIGWRLLK